MLRESRLNRSCWRESPGNLGLQLRAVGFHGIQALTTSLIDPHWAGLTRHGGSSNMEYVACKLLLRSHADVSPTKLCAYVREWIPDHTSVGSPSTALSIVSGALGWASVSSRAKDQASLIAADMPSCCGATMAWCLWLVLLSKLGPRMAQGGGRFSHQRVPRQSRGGARQRPSRQGRRRASAGPSLAPL